MKVTLSTEAERWVQDRLDSGEYQSSAAVVEEALRLLRDREAENASLRALVREGIDAADAGRSRPLDVAIADVKRRGRERLARG